MAELAKKTQVEPKYLKNNHFYPDEDLNQDL